MGELLTCDVAMRVAHVRKDAWRNNRYCSSEGASLIVIGDPTCKLPYLPPLPREEGPEG